MPSLMRRLDAQQHGFKPTSEAYICGLFTLLHIVPCSRILIADQWLTDDRTSVGTQLRQVLVVGKMKPCSSQSSVRQRRRLAPGRVVGTSSVRVAVGWSMPISMVAIKGVRGVQYVRCCSVIDKNAVAGVEKTAISRRKTLQSRPVRNESLSMCATAIPNVCSSTKLSYQAKIYRLFFPSIEAKQPLEYVGRFAGMKLSGAYGIRAPCKGIGALTARR